ncbi:hypothetical protein A3A64_04035 [Candidatus Gottesmanbacteria bacterium RIFCSPLOWO2_01_FULL_48_11]|uniref:Uncharacterized protein n=2 Tax=Candidatus Gottesmaniibacteriota TaxID=1752720 RepID=A0A0G1TZ80_9BACT|nr:MAG: hypothetical protein UY16_C0039G0004 [Candidatus Gottesmanbacteria bacterium GW2011_GWA2_47_9]OGG28063.1 MAG: hypothetical protein A3A64_04035 [Candidatus Gottesmanbacteria bacterium RIFCSPLOWO2_01_FULL_48_11]
MKLLEAKTESVIEQTSPLGEHVARARAILVANFVHGLIDRNGRNPVTPQEIEIVAIDEFAKPILLALPPGVWESGQCCIDDQATTYGRLVVNDLRRGVSMAIEMGYRHSPMATMELHARLGGGDMGGSGKLWEAQGQIVRGPVVGSFIGDYTFLVAFVSVVGEQIRSIGDARVDGIVVRS